MSPANKVEGLGSSLSRSAGNIKCRPMERKGSVGMANRAYSAKSRFQQPSAATSLPALALIEVEVRPPTVKDGKKIADLKRSTMSTPLARRHSTNIAKMKKDVKDITEDCKKPVRTRSSLGLSRKTNSRESSEKEGKRKDGRQNAVKEESKESLELKESKDENEVENTHKNEDIELEIEKSSVSEIHNENLDR